MGNYKHLSNKNRHFEMLMKSNPEFHDYIDIVKKMHDLTWTFKEFIAEGFNQQYLDNMVRLRADNTKLVNEIEEIKTDQRKVKDELYQFEKFVMEGDDNDDFDRIKFV